MRLCVCTLPCACEYTIHKYDLLLRSKRSFVIIQDSKINSKFVYLTNGQKYLESERFLFVFKSYVVASII